MPCRIAGDIERDTSAAGYGQSTYNKGGTLGTDRSRTRAIKAEPWVQIDPGPGVFIEGPAFNRQGDLYIVSVFDGRVLKITSDKKVDTIFSKKGLMPTGLAFHKDGRLFVACISGEVLSMNADGSNPTFYKVRTNGKPATPNDCV
ncbi:MAG: hypothetical protein JRJ65_21220, partial [Deltaproteobacteria bacterium]|nr:hypothetical protein [Deltaproteobacteria bacterium]